MSEDLLIRRDGDVMTITINRPERRNAISPEVVEGLSDAFRGSRKDPSLRVIVLTAVGSRRSAQALIWLPANHSSLITPSRDSPCPKCIGSRVTATFPS